jgi:antitoxin component YwqK of YwqJK toxin-antitoxin module|tara:strand:- start:15413 stop:16027 length:615 start_codon:yes stop_codon:yes gene_type:complete
MKVYKLLIILFILSSCQIVDNIDLAYYFEPNIPNIEIYKIDSTVKRDSKGKLRYNNELFSGYLVQKNATGQLLVKTGFVEGLEEGDMLGFYPNGDKRYIRPYVHGEKHGTHQGWYPSGQLQFQYHFEMGLSVGNHRDWFPDGSPLQDMNYVAGHHFGTQKVWRADGKIRSNYVIRENGKRYGLMGIKRCTKIDTKTQKLDPYKG